MPGPWMTSGCSDLQYRLGDDGSFEVDGEGVLTTPLPAQVPPWQALAEQVGAAEGVPAYLLAGVMSLESGGNPNAGSPAGAMGLLQLIASTASSLNGAPLTSAEIFVPKTNLTLGARYLHRLAAQYGGNWCKAFFAYNAGSARCGGGTSHGYSDPSDKGNACAPNRWNLVADCYSSTAGTVDYASPVMKYANAALAAGWGQGSGAAGASGGLSVADAVLGAGIVVAGFAATKTLLLPWLARRG